MSTLPPYGPWPPVSQSIRFSRQNYWVELPCPHQGIFLTQIKPASLMSRTGRPRFFTTSSTWLCTQGLYIHTLRKAGECLLNHSYFPNKRMLSASQFIREGPNIPGLQELSPPFLKLVSLCVILCFPVMEPTFLPFDNNCES